MSDRPTTHEGTAVAIVLFLVGAVTSAVSIIAWVGPPSGVLGMFLAIVGALLVPAALVITLAFKAKSRGMRQVIAVLLLLAVHTLWPAIAILSGRDSAAFAAALLTLLGEVDVPMLSSTLDDISAPKKSPAPANDPARCVEKPAWTSADCRALYDNACDPSLVAQCGAKVPPEQVGALIELAARDFKAMQASFGAMDASCGYAKPYEGGPLSLRKSMKAEDAELHAAALKLNDTDRDVRAAALLLFTKERQPSKVVDEEKLHEVALDALRGDNFIAAMSAYTSGFLTAKDNPALIEHLLRANAPMVYAQFLIDNPHFSDDEIAQLLPLTHLPRDAPLCETLNRAELATVVCFAAGHPGRKVPGAQQEIRRAADEIDEFAKRVPPYVKDKRHFQNTCRTISDKP
jgi:hypothetical protein